nr:SDR family oxidoreductase [Rubrimonas cliftonensis]
MTVLVTGANRGVGRAMASAFAARGDRVLATCRNPADCDGVARLAEARGTVESYTLDVTDPAHAETLAEILADQAIDLLVCNAGALIGRGGLAAPDYDAKAFSTVLMTNVAGPFFTVRAFLPHLRRSGAGKVAVISSAMGSAARARGDAYIYRASKAAATNLAVNLAIELKGLGVAVGAYHPGWVRTDMGGAEAEVSPEESAAGLLARFDALTLERTGVFEDHLGRPISF